jgi:hypothetical protein
MLNQAQVKNVDVMAFMSVLFHALVWRPCIIPNWVQPTRIQT